MPSSSIDESHQAKDAPRSAALAGATQRAYRADWAHFAAWCSAHGHTPIPAAMRTLTAYLADLAPDHTASTIRRRLAAIGTMHRFNALPWDPRHPALRAALRDAALRARAPSGKAAPLTRALLHRLLATCDETARGRRDRAVLLFGFAGALRRSEIVALRVEDVVEQPGGLVLQIRGRGEGASAAAAVALPRSEEDALCPVRAWRAWQALARRTAGALFRPISRSGRIGGGSLHPDAVRRILNHRVALAGFDAEEARRLSAHALRAGFVAEAQERGLGKAEIMRHTRYKDRRSLRAAGLGAA
ncbi:tyrosine-type recombinase/integrase [Acidisoma sp. 7E03]